MTASKSLPARPSLESLRKQAKTLARDTANGDAAAIARTRVQLPTARLPLTQRNAQLVIAREYGYAGWQDLTAEVSKRLGDGLEWAAAQANRAIHDNDFVWVKELLAEYPALLSWEGGDDHTGLVGFATGAYGDAFGPEREAWFTRATCAEMLIDAGAVVRPAVVDGLLQSRAVGLLHLFNRKRLLPRTLKFLAALGDVDAVRASLAAETYDLTTINEAFGHACRFQHEAIASLLLDRSIALDPELGRRLDEAMGRAAFVRYFTDTRSVDFEVVATDGPWRAFLMDQVTRALDEGDLSTFVSALERAQWLLGDAYVEFQAGLIGRATMRNRADFIVALLDLRPALGRRQPPPKSPVYEFAATYARLHLVPLLSRIWPPPDDLPFAAAMGDLTRVRRWFDESGAPVLGDVERHFPYSSNSGMEYRYAASRVQMVLDTALAWSVINRRFDVADFLLAHGADINTRWSSHEPASILHELVGQAGTGENPASFESMRFLIDRGIDMTIEDYRWKSTAKGWARYAVRDEKLVAWLEAAEREREVHARRDA